MLPALRRPAALLLTVLFPASLALSACGSDDNSFGTVEGFDAVSISGEVGSTPKFDWKHRLEPGKAQTKVLAEGDGPTLAAGDTVKVDFVVADGWTHQTDINTYDAKSEASPVLLTVGQDPQPSDVSDLFGDLVADHIDPGTTVGTRIAMTVGVHDALGDYLADPQNGANILQWLSSHRIGNDDGMAIVFDVTSKIPNGPQGKKLNPPAGVPKIVEKNGEPTKLDFSGVPKPDGELHTTVLVKGTGPAVKTGEPIHVNYLGEVYKAKQPFDESYSKNQLLTATLGPQTTLVKGWSKALIGKPVGSRVLFQVPPELGYGKKGQPQAGIKGTDTMYFVVDILAAG